MKAVRVLVDGIFYLENATAKSPSLGKKPYLCE